MKQEDKRVLYEGKYLRMVARGSWEYVERTGAGSAAIIVPVLGSGADKKLVLVKEWRVPIQAYNYSLPAGLVADHGQDEGPGIAAKRELLEETGYEAGRMRFLTSGIPSSGLTTEMLYFYLADDLKQVHEGGGIEDEDITVQIVRVDEVEEWLKAKSADGHFVDPKIYIALYFAKSMDTI